MTRTVLFVVLAAIACRPMDSNRPAAGPGVTSPADLDASRCRCWTTITDGEDQVAIRMRLCEANESVRGWMEWRGVDGGYAVHMLSGTQQIDDTFLLQDEMLPVSRPAEGSQFCLVDAYLLRLDAGGGLRGTYAAAPCHQGKPLALESAPNRVCAVDPRPQPWGAGRNAGDRRSSPSCTVEVETPPLSPVEQQAVPEPCEWGDHEVCRERCKQAQPESCYTLGQMYDLGTSVQKSVKHAALYFDWACTFGHMCGCNDAGVAYSNGNGVRQSSSEASIYFARACQGQLPVACFNLAEAHDAGLGVEQDFAKAFDFFTKGCDLGGPYACRRVGFAHEHARGVSPADPSRAAEFYRRGCDGDDGGACYRLAELYRHGRGVERHPARAERLFEKACDDLKLDHACVALVELGLRPPEDGPQPQP